MHYVIKTLAQAIIFDKDNLKFDYRYCITHYEIVKSEQLIINLWKPIIIKSVLSPTGDIIWIFWAKDITSYNQEHYSWSLSLRDYYLSLLQTLWCATVMSKRHIIWLVKWLYTKFCRHNACVCLPHTIILFCCIYNASGNIYISGFQTGLLCVLASCCWMTICS